MTAPPWARVSLTSTGGRALAASLLALLLLLGPRAVDAQVGADRDLDLTSLRTPPGPDPLLSAEGTALTRPGAVSFSAMLRWADRPLVLRDGDGEPLRDAFGAEAALVSGRLGLDLGLAVGVVSWLELGLSFPLTLFQDGEHRLYQGGDATDLVADLPALAGAGFGDLRLRAKATIFSSANDGFGLGFVLEGVFPTALRGGFLGDGGLGLEALVLGDLRLQGWHVALVLGYRLRPERHFGDLDVDDEFLWRLALRAPLPRDLSILADISGAHGLFGPDGAFGAQDENPIVAHLGLELPAFRDVRLTLAGGLGLTSGYGAPRFDLLTTIRYQPQDHDVDGDGLMDYQDRCPEIPEDLDGTEDEDGCPDEDNDGDGLQDFIDGCPDEAEDLDGFDDDDGCPDPDNDGDGLLDANDRCPEEAEDFDGSRDEDGCPDPDADGDGIEDEADGCDEAAEDLDGFEDGDGCPDPDNDQDDVLDADDQCPTAPEDLDGFEDGDGCPDEDNDGDGVIDVQDRCPLEAEDDDDFADEDGCPELGGRLRTAPVGRRP